MQPSIFDLLALAHLSTGRRVSLYAQWQPLVAARGLTAIDAYITRARAHDVGTKDLEHLWATQKRWYSYSPQTKAVNDTVDQILVGMEEMVTGQIRGLPAHETLYQVGAGFLAEVFPKGAGVITNLPYVEQVVVVENLVTKLGTTLAGEVDALGLTAMVARLADANVEYQQAVNVSDNRVDFARVRAANRRGLAYVAELVCMILAVYHDSDDPAHMAAREELLAPLMMQDERARADWRARRRGEAEAEPGTDGEPDVEPGTGDEDQDADMELRILAELGDVADMK